MGPARKRILIVDDDLEIRETVRDVLEEEGYVVEVAGDGREALASLRAKAKEPALLPEIILLDLMMPEMNGWQFCEEQDKDVALAQIPVVVISAASSTERHSALKKHPVLKKPLELTRMIEAIERHARPQTG